MSVVARLDPDGRRIHPGVGRLADAHNVATDGTCDIPSTYLQVVAVKRS